MHNSEAAQTQDASNTAGPSQQDVDLDEQPTQPFTPVNAEKQVSTFQRHGQM